MDTSLDHSTLVQSPLDLSVEVGHHVILDSVRYRVVAVEQLPDGRVRQTLLPVPHEQP